VGQSG